jgi:hypothetical protein
MANFRHTGVGNGTARTDYAALGQLQDGSTNWTAAGGSSDALTATYTPALTVLLEGQLCFLRAAAANTGTTPTFSPNGLTAHTITRYGGAALVAGDIPAPNAEIVLRYNIAGTRWELLNPANPVNNTTVGGTAAMLVPTGTTAQRPGSPTAGGIRYNSQTSAYEGYDGTAWRKRNAPAGVGPNVQSFTSGTSATYTTPSGALYLVIEMVGGGGGGGGSGTASASGTAGGSTSFNSVVAAGGAQGVAATTSNGQNGGSGGAGGTGSASARFPGQTGGPGGNGATGSIGGPGGLSVFGGAGPSGTATINAGAAQANTGSGGGGGGPTATPTGGGGGGGAGEYVRLVIANPSASYTYTVGAGGGGGSGGGGTNGGNGAAGVIIVTAYFQ